MSCIRVLLPLTSRQLSLRLFSACTASLHEPASGKGPPLDPFTDKLSKKADQDLQEMTAKQNSDQTDAEEDWVDVRSPCLRAHATLCLSGS